MVNVESINKPLKYIHCLSLTIAYIEWYNHLTSPVSLRLPTILRLTSGDDARMFNSNIPSIWG